MVLNVLWDDGACLPKCEKGQNPGGFFLGWFLRNSLLSLSWCFTERDDSGSGIVTSLLSWMDGSWLDSLYAFYTLASADGIGLAE